MVIDLPFEGRNVEGSQKYRRRDVEGKKPSLNQLILALESSTQYLSANDDIGYRWPIHQSSDQSNSGRKEIEKPPCGKETEGQELRSRRDHQSSR